MRGLVLGLGVHRAVLLVHRRRMTNACRPYASLSWFCQTTSAKLTGTPRLKKEFIQAGITQFGSGWCWLSIQNGKLVVNKTPNAENTLIHGMKPILGCDLWEHSYYVDYKNRRPEYLENFYSKLINWEFVESNLE